MSGVWLSIDDVARRVNRCDDIVRERMAQTPAHIEKPWINVSTAKRPEYQFTSEAAVDRWWQEVHLWRASENEAGSGKSDGASPAPTGAPSSAAPPSRGRRTRTSSSRASLDAKSSAPDTSGRPSSTFSFLRLEKA